MAKKTIPQIGIPIMKSNGSMELAWYLFLQWLAENAGKTDLSDYFTKEETNTLLSAKLDLTDAPSVLYGTNGSGEQYLYNVSYFAADSGVVHLAGEETITGIKHFTNSRGIDIKSPANAAGSGYRITDSNDLSKVSYLLQYKTSNNDVHTRVLNSAYNTNAYIDIVISEDGKRRISLYQADIAQVVPPTETSTSSNQIDTVGARATAINTRADTSLDNLTSDGKNIANWSTNITNDMVKIPQDIKLSLSGNVLTLASGSKLCSAAGVVSTVSGDRTLTLSLGTFTGKRLIFATPAGNMQDSVDVTKITSGSTEPESPANLDVFFNSSTKIIRLYSGGAWIDWSVCVPIAELTVNNGTIISMQPFNGFGYMGSTVFALPGVEFLCPDGRNSDGSLKNVTGTFSTIRFATYSTGIVGSVYVFTSSRGSSLECGGAKGVTFLVQDKAPTVAAYYQRWYSPLENQWYCHTAGGTQWLKTSQVCVFGHVTYTDYKVSDLDPYSVFRATDYNDFMDLNNEVQTKDAKNVKLTGNQTINGTKTFNDSIKVGSTLITPTGSIELTPLTTASYGGYINFHYAGSTADYTSRIIESASGQLNIDAPSGVKLSSSTIPATASNSGAVPSTSWVRKFVNDEYTPSKASGFIMAENFDILLTFDRASGVLTLRSGSKIYVPNGVNTFDSETISGDKTFSASGSGTARAYIVYYPGDGTIKSFAESIVQSGTSYTVTDGLWYDTTNNSIKRIVNGSVSYSGLSLPLCVIQITNGTVTNIDYIFNGFGYIGSVFFALPGLKVACPNARNSDCSPRSTIATNTIVRTVTNTAVGSTDNSRVVTLNGNSGLEVGTGFVIRKTEAELTKAGWLRQYCLDTNKIWVWTGTAWSQQWQVPLAYYSTTSSTSQIASIHRKETLNILNKCDTDFISHQAMPSAKFIDLGSGTSGNNYIAPADGWFVIRKVSTATQQNINLTINSNGLGAQFVSQGANEGPVIFVQVQKGDTVNYTTNFGGETQYFRFIYANGDI